MSRWMDDGVERYLTELAQVEHDTPVLVEMEELAKQRRFPIVGRATGRYLELAARAVGARRVMELGSGYGYSAYWFAQAVGPDGEVICTDADPDNAKLAEDYLRRAGVWDRVRYRVGDALQGLQAETGDFDIVYCDVDKDGYPDCWRAGRERIRGGGIGAARGDEVDARCPVPRRVSEGCAFAEVQQDRTGCAHEPRQPGTSARGDQGEVRREAAEQRMVRGGPAHVVRQIGARDGLDDLPKSALVAELGTDAFPQRRRLTPRSQQRGLELGLLEHPLGERIPLGVVGVEECRWRPAVDLGCQRPAEVDGVL